MKNSDENEDVSSKQINYGVSVADHIFKRIEKHVRLLKCLEDKSHTKQKWIMNALKAKLDQKHDEATLKSCHLQLKIDHELNEKIEFHVNIMKKFKRSYSKKQLIVEAIYEQLEREEDKTKQLLQNLQNKPKK